MQNSFLAHHDFGFLPYGVVQSPKMWLSIFCVCAVCGMVIKIVPLINGKNTLPEEKVGR